MKWYMRFDCVWIALWKLNNLTIVLAHIFFYPWKWLGFWSKYSMHKMLMRKSSKDVRHNKKIQPTEASV